MRYKIISFFVLFFLALAYFPGAYSQSSKGNKNSAKQARARTDSIAKARKKQQETLAKNRQKALDSARNARTHAMDSASASRKQKTDSIKLAREQKTDSVARARKKVTDSAAAARKYKESKKYRDSVTKAKDKKAKALTDARTARTDSLKEIRKHITDSTTGVRQARSDSMKAVQKHRSDSLAKVKKYKASKRYTDSVTLVKRHRTDSIKAVQKEFRDSIATVRKHSMDSAKLVRTKKMDSMKLVRKKHTDSLATARKTKTDSLNKKKDAKSKLAKANEKKKQEAMKLKLELKLKQKREEWSNQTMLKKGWGPKRRLFQNSFTHYNYYYNANRKMEEAELNMQRVNKDNYDSLIGLFPFDPNKDSTLLAADMDSIIHKVSVGIQIHDPRIKWGNDMYLILGQAYYYKGNYEHAATSFRYIIANDQKNKNKKGKGRSSGGSRPKGAPSIVDSKKRSKLAFWQHRSVHNDAILWLARTYATAGQVENGESVLSLLEYDADLPSDLVGRLAVEKAFAYLKTENYVAASEQLKIAVDDRNLPIWLRTRIAFLNGQLLQNMGNYEQAAESFETVVDNFPKMEMDFYARKYIATNKLMAGKDVEDATIPLKRILKDAKYATYYDQVYYVLGKLSAKAGKNNEAINYYVKGTKAPKATKKQKAQLFAALGDVYYANASYASAKGAYDSAAKYAGNAKDKTIAAATQRSTGLAEISGPANTIHETDSMLALAAMSKREQQQVARRYLREQEKKLQDSMTTAENAGATAVAAEAADNDKDNSASWYFANPSQISQGSGDFKRKWGTRPLADNWRRAAAMPLSAGTKPTTPTPGADDDDEEDGGKGIAKTENGLPTEESLLAKVPNTPQQKELAYKVQQKAYILLAKAYEKQLQDHTRALHTLDTLNIRYRAHTQKEEELFLRYQIAVKEQQLDKAQVYAQELLAKFPTSQYASILRPGKSESKATNDNVTEVAAYFDETYDMLMRHQYTEAQMRATMAKKKYENPLYHRRFEVLEAMAYAGAGNYDMADTVISQFLRTNPADTLTEWARSVKKYIGEVRNGGKPSWYKDGPLPVAGSTPKKATEEKARPEEVAPAPPPVLPDVPPVYSYKADSPHYCIVVLPGVDFRTAGLKKAVRDFDSAKYAATPLELLIDFYRMKEAVFIVKGFPSAGMAQAYMKDLAALPALGEFGKEEIGIMVISAQNYKKMFADKDPEGYRAFYNASYPK
ncbi:hypothetical protein GCM10023093_00570 [Nemorincola caseinilytica]|uniref:Tetratricopeptide repeat protein n=1 Tax=Nemorincola caseinilytica TaxID=2054315 RepID=A0ABP8N5D1_9BACT